MMMRSVVVVVMMTVIQFFVLMLCNIIILSSCYIPGVCVICMCVRMNGYCLLKCAKTRQELLIMEQGDQ